MADIRRYTPEIDEIALSAIVRFLGLALQNRDSSLVSCGNDLEILRIRDGYAKKLLGLDPVTSISAIEHVCQRMRADKAKHRVTFYYLMAQHTNTLEKLQ